MGHDKMLLCKIDQQPEAPFTIKLEDGATCRDLRDALRTHQAARLPKDYMLIANGAELRDDALLETLGEFWFRTHSIYLRAVDQNACREWQGTGRCKLGQNCPFKGTHDHTNSPRYIAYQVRTPSSSIGSSPQSSPRDGFTPGSPNESCSLAQQPFSPVQQPQPCSPAQCSPCTPPQPRAPTVCRNWSKNGHCRFGDQCHFVATHTAENLPRPPQGQMPPAQMPQAPMAPYGPPVLLSQSLGTPEQNSTQHAMNMHMFGPSHLSTTSEYGAGMGYGRENAWYGDLPPMIEQFSAPVFVDTPYGPRHAEQWQAGNIAMQAKHVPGPGFTDGAFSQMPTMHAWNDGIRSA